MTLPPPALIGLRILLGVAFLWAGLDKLLHPDAFAPLVLSYQVVPLPLVNLVVFWLPVCEVLIAGLLIAGIWVRAAALLFSALLAVFMVGIAQALARGIELHCGCFSTEPTTAARTWGSLWEEAMLLGAGLVLWSNYWEVTKRERRVAPLREAAEAKGIAQDEEAAGEHKQRGE